MKSKLISVLKISVFFAIGLLLVWLSFKDLSQENIAQLKKSLVDANYSWIFLSVIVGLFSHVLRAYRWNMLAEPLGYQAKLSNSFFAVMVGYLVNYGVPRLGEVSRCTLLNKYEKIPFTKSFGTVVAERVFDLIFFFLIVLIMLFTQYAVISTYLSQTFYPILEKKYVQFSENKTILAVISGILFILIVSLFLLRRKLKNLLSEKVSGFIKGFYDGLISVKKVKRPVWFIFQTALIWFCYYLALYFCFFSFKESSVLGFNAAITAFVFGSLTVMVTPGGIGAYPYAIQKVLLLIYGVNEATGASLGWLSWCASFIVIVFTGLISLVLLPLLNRNYKPSSIL